MMSLQKQPELNSRMVHCSLLGNNCHMYAVNCNSCNYCTMDVCPRWHLLTIICTLLKCQLWYLTVGVTTALSATVKALGSHYSLFWFCCSPVSVNCWNVATCCMSTALYVDPNNFVLWDNHQGVDPADRSYIILVFNE